jgi:hypothetical protein
MKYPEWYSFFNGPKSLKELAKQLNKGDVYRTLYSSWSKISHVSDANHLTFLLEDGTTVLGPIRNPMNSFHVGSSALTILLEATRLLMNKYRPFEAVKLNKWFAKEIRESLIFLARSEIDQLKWFDQKFMQKE